MQPALTQPPSPSTATLKELALAYKQAKELKEQQAGLLAHLDALPPRTKNKKVLVENAKQVHTRLYHDFYDCVKNFKREFMKGFCDNAKRFEKALPTSTLISDSNKELCQKVLETIKSQTDLTSTTSVTKNGVWFFVDVQCHYDGSVSKVCLYTEETKHHGLLTAYGNFRHYISGKDLEANQYEVKAWSQTFKTPSELKEFAVACDFMDTLLECLLNAKFVSASSEAFEVAYKAKIEELLKEIEAEEEASE